MEQLSTGTRIKHLREQRYWTQRRLAREAGVTDQTISNLERGARPSMETALAVAQALGTSVESLFLPVLPTDGVGLDPDEIEPSAGSVGLLGASTDADATSPGGTSGDGRAAA